MGEMQCECGATARSATVHAILCFHRSAMQDCPLFAKSFDWAAAQACKPVKGTLDHGVGNIDYVPVKTLPGCNPLWGGKQIECRSHLSKLIAFYLSLWTKAYLLNPCQGSRRV